jgi:hypothetical protein
MGPPGSAGGSEKGSMRTSKPKERCMGGGGVPLPAAAAWGRHWSRPRPLALALPIHNTDTQPGLWGRRMPTPLQPFLPGPTLESASTADAPPVTSSDVRASRRRQLQGVRGVGQHGELWPRSWVVRPLSAPPRAACPPTKWAVLPLPLGIVHSPPAGRIQHTAERGGVVGGGGRGAAPNA